MKEIFRTSLDKAMTYQEYRQLLDELHAQGKTTGPNQSEIYLRHARLNLQRMKRLDKTGKLSLELLNQIKALQKNYIFLTITEGWCGDAAQILPLVEKMAAASPNIQHKLVLRDENPDLMDRYLTRGGKAIPITIILDADSGEEVAKWGPRPAAIQEVVVAYNEAPQPKESFDEFSEKVHAWYAKNKTQDLQAEWTELFKELE